MVKISRVRSVASRRSKSEIGVAVVIVDLGLVEVDGASRESRSLLRYGQTLKTPGIGSSTHPLDKLLPRYELLSLPGMEST